MDDYLKFLSVMSLPVRFFRHYNVQAKYKEALTLITDTGMRPGEAFKQSGFIEAYEKEGGGYGEEGKNAKG